MNDKQANLIDDEDTSAWLQQIRTELDTSTHDLDAHTLSRLNRARQQALLQMTSTSPRTWHWLLLAGAASLALALALMLLPNLRPTATITAPIAEAGATSVEDFELLTEGESLALYSDLDFYAWLDTQDLEG